MKNRVLAALLAVMLSLNLVPNSQLTVHAEDEAAIETALLETADEGRPEEETGETENGKITEYVRMEGKDEEAGETEQPEEEPASHADEVPAADAGEMDLSLRLLYGDKELQDEDALILLFLADGFTVSELDSFYGYVKRGSKYLMETSPWKEFTNNVKIYAIGTVSNESGVKGDKAVNYSQAQADTRDTYFGTYYWSGGTQRAVGMGQEGAEKLKALKEMNNIETDCDIILVNSVTEGGTTDTREKRCFFSIDAQINDCLVHELGHAIANLADEYWPGRGYESANMTAESDPEKVKWARFIGKNGVGVYEHQGQGWYRPSQTCKMQILGSDQEHPFCEVCKEAHRDKISSMSNVTNIAFQTYADKFYEGQQKDMSEYFILRKGENKKTGAELGGAFHLTYKDSEGNIVDGIPDKRGDYVVSAVFDGNGEFDACSLEAEYSIDYPDLIKSVDISSKEYDGEPAELNYTVDEEINNDNYDVRCTYTGSSPYSMHPETVYESSEAPKLPGNYTVQVAAYDKKSDELVARKSKEFEIKFKAVPLVVNDDPAYAGANSATSNFVYYIFGEGYTAEEQDKFIKDAKEFVKNFLLEEPFRGMSSYLNFYAIQTVSEASGIGKAPGNTFFELSFGEDGVIKSNTYNAGTDSELSSFELARDISYDKLDPYYRTPIIMVNGGDEAKGTATGGAAMSHGSIAVPATAEGAKYAAREATNIFMGNEIGHEAASEEELEKQKGEYLEYLAYSRYTMILSDIYKYEIVENGKPVDIMPYIHTYNTSIEIPNSMLYYNLTYYADKGGEPAEQPLEGIPSEPGTYHVYVTLEPTNSDNGRIEGDFSELGIRNDWLRTTKAWITFKIEHADAVRVEAVQPTYDKGGNTAYWYCQYCGKYYADVNGVMDETTPYDDHSPFLLPALSAEDPDNKPGTETDNKPGTSSSDTGNSTANTSSDSSNNTSRTRSPQTGDASNTALWILLLAVSAAAGVTGYRKRESSR